MFKVVSKCAKIVSASGPMQLRTFLSPAYYCNEVWDRRLASPLLQNVNLDEFYIGLEQRHQKSKQVSAVDVDLFANALSDDKFHEELLDLLHKLRLSAETSNTLNSTSHAAIRTLMRGSQMELLDALDDRLNYGLFLDTFTANLLLDTFWKDRDYLSGARVASQMMLQEDYESPLTNCLCLLHCYKYLQEPKAWPQVELPPEPEEEIKIRVKYLRNPYDDEHFDLKEANKIVGKTLIGLTRGKQDQLSQSFHLLGWILFGKQQQVDQLLMQQSATLCKEILDLIPPELTRPDVKTESLDVEKLLTTEVEKFVNSCSEQDIAKQCEYYSKWDQERMDALNEQIKRLETAQRLETVKDLQSAIKEKETKLWFFENEEKIELDILAKRVFYPKRWDGKKKKPRKVDEGYIPPEIRNTHNF